MINLNFMFPPEENIKQKFISLPVSASSPVSIDTPDTSSPLRLGPLLRESRDPWENLSVTGSCRAESEARHSCLARPLRRYRKGTDQRVDVRPADNRCCEQTAPSNTPGR